MLQYYVCLLVVPSGGDLRDISIGVGEGAVGENAAPLDGDIYLYA